LPCNKTRSDALRNVNNAANNRQFPLNCVQILGSLTENTHRVRFTYIISSADDETCPIFYRRIPTSLARARL